MTIIAQINEAMAGQLPGHLGINIESAGLDEVVGTLTVEEKLCTTGGILHGGTMALADTLGAVGTFLNLPPNTRTSTVESKTNFLRPARMGTKVIATCRPVNRGRTLMLWSTEVRDAEGNLMAVVSQSQIVIPIS
jgi:1,4-dihydroxy-2-naphthoyl-CoA hydrolase